MKVCILAAGMGSRSFAKTLHKALLPLGNKAILSHIIGQFPPDSEFVIAVGYEAQQIKDFVAIAHPSLRVIFVPVDPYQGVGSGPGYSLLSCKEFLQEPFIFTACDTLIMSPLPTIETNWIGVAPVIHIEKWCSVEAKDGIVKNIYYKQQNVPTDLAFVGIAGIKDFNTFWQKLETTSDDGEIQVNAGLEGLIDHQLLTMPITWRDTGDAQSYLQLLQDYDRNYSFTGKTTEITYRYGQTIVKSFTDNKSAFARFQRAQEYQHIFSRVLQHHGKFLSYEFQTGKLLSQSLNGPECLHFLEWAEKNLWKKRSVEVEDFQTNIRKFYRDKTKTRLANFYARSNLDPVMEKKVTMINKLACAPVEELIAQAMPILEQTAIPSTFHGDLHADNILKTDKGYILIDWRDSFGDSTIVGDRYYDLGKFYHTLDLSVEVMDKAQFKIEKNNCHIQLEHHIDEGSKAAQQVFWEFVSDKGYNQKAIACINGLIFVNMAPLYETQLGEYLYYLGRYSLQKALLQNV